VSDQPQPQQFQLPPAQMQLFLAGFEDAKPQDVNGTQVLPMAFHGVGVVVTAIAPTGDWEKIANQILSACRKAKLTNGVPNGIITPKDVNFTTPPTKT
jgi:hypothetical protein